MKKNIFILAMIAASAVFLGACHHSGMHHAGHAGHVDAEKIASHHHGVSMTDERTVLNLPPEIKTVHKNAMRKHLETLGDVIAALGANDLKKAGAVMRINLGTNPDEELMCRHLTDMSGEEDLFKLGMDVHKKADEFAEVAAKGDRDASLKALAIVVNACNACHAKYRH